MLPAEGAPDAGGEGGRPSRPSHLGELLTGSRAPLPQGLALLAQHFLPKGVSGVHIVASSPAYQAWAEDQGASEAGVWRAAAFTCWQSTEAGMF